MFLGYLEREEQKGLTLSLRIRGGIKCCSHTSVLKHNIYASLQHNCGKIHEAKSAILNKRSVK